MARNEFNRGMDRNRNESFERSNDRNFDRSGYNSRTSLDQGRITMGEDEGRYFDRGQRREGWNSGDMRQNDFGTRNYSDDNFRSTRWGSENPERRERGQHFGKGPKGWKRSDERIREEACEALYRDSEVDASDIDIKVKDGTLTLSGTVDSRDSKRSAERCVENLSGVDDVHNELRVIRQSGSIADLRGRSGQEQGKSALS